MKSGCSRDNTCADVKEDIMNVAAVVVTYNRKELLRECLDSIIQQSCPVKKIILIDNASADGTYSMLAENHYLDKDLLIYRRMQHNLGGAGGFYEGIKIARDLDCDWIWVMDDDTIPSKDCLLELLNAEKTLVEKNGMRGKDCIRKVAYLASAIYGPDGEYMNIPEVSLRPSPNGYAYWYAFLEDGLIAIKRATFVSLLINRDAVIRCGLPCKDYFIWGDDTEYTMRLFEHYGEGFFVGKSIAIHKRANAGRLYIDTENNIDRIRMYRYYYRNELINARYYYGRKQPIKDILRAMVRGITLLPKEHGIEKARAVVKGRIEAAIQYKKFESYINDQINGGR